ncbi:MAG: type VI secretion system-associated FHA domain protein TagH [Mitsuaria chitosanitabida]|uniref:type VI secretion system-associated FHA domain protein TagH n=1 Tax=Roseateles chitosanitabidus TaxID=65048 RepID=UPI001AFE0461|nr:type VI secretion system-associated FHA domain protein TagH [Roseateles chitosanitabidus]MBO9687489.1 type VI secretion system-associated FHA domain protein TagH [Roseateles chitosanitabidus]
MTLTLRAVSLNDLPLTQPITARFDANGGTIGRADHNTMALPDPERHISRQQAEIRVDAGAFVICNVGSANPITVGGQSVQQGQAVPLRHRDEVRIGGYLLEVQNESDEVDAGSTVIRRAPELPRDVARATGPITAPGALSPMPPILPIAASATASSAGLSGSNPFADLLGGPSSSADPLAAFHAPMTPPPVHRPPAVAAPAGPAMLPDDFDPFAPPAPRAAPPSQSAFPDAPPSQAGSPFDPFGGFDSPRSPPPAQPPRDDLGFGGAFSDLVPGDANRSLDDLFGLQPSGADPLAGFMAGAAQTPGEPHGGVSADPLALFGAAASHPTPAHSEPMTPALPDHTPALNSSFRPPEVRPTPRPMPPAQPQPAQIPEALPPVAGPGAPAQPQVLPPSFEQPAMPQVSHAGAQHAAQPAAPQASWPAAQQPQAAPVAPPQPAYHVAPPVARPAAAPTMPGQAADTAALWSAFCEGAGVRMAAPPQGLNPDLMRVIGQLLRSTVDGTLQMMAVRAATKHELRAQVTVIRSRDNNPLKFSPDAQSALEQLLQPPVRGFLPGPAAMQDAMRDLVGHTIGTMAGTRAALEGVLTRFQPSALEAKLTSRSVLDSVLAMNRKAKLWELYLQHFDSIRDEAQEDFHTLFGKAFLEAYEDQLERLMQHQAEQASAGAGGSPGQPAPQTSHQSAA